jgi:hypothetical protein
VELCPKTVKKIEEKMRHLGFLGFWGMFGKKGNQGVWVADDGWVRWKRAGGGVLAVGEVVGGGGMAYFGC